MLQLIRPAMLVGMDRNNRVPGLLNPPLVADKWDEKKNEVYDNQLVQCIDEIVSQPQD